MEEWRSYRNQSKYDVSNEGRVRNSRTGRILKQTTNDRGYKTVTFRVGDERRTYRVSRLVAETFIDGEYDGMDVTYIDGNKENVRLDNLEYRTRGEIIRKTYDDGRKQTHAMKPIRCVETGEEFESIKECARVMGVDKTCISRCVNQRSFRTRDGYHFEAIE